jgi:hypothetical protein
MLVGVSRRVSFPMGADEGQAPSASQYRDTDALLTGLAYQW